MYYTCFVLRRVIDLVCGFTKLLIPGLTPEPPRICVDSCELVANNISVDPVILSKDYSSFGIRYSRLVYLEMGKLLPLFPKIVPYTFNSPAVLF